MYPLAPAKPRMRMIAAGLANIEALSIDAIRDRWRAGLSASSSDVSPMASASRRSRAARARARALAASASASAASASASATNAIASALDLGVIIDRTPVSITVSAVATIGVDSQLRRRPIRRMIIQNPPGTMTAVDSPEKTLFASTTQAFLQKEAPLRYVRELHAGSESFDPAWWRRAAELGWTSLLVPEELGGGSVSESGIADLAMVAEQLGKTVAPGPLYPVSTVLAALVDCTDPQTHVEIIESLMAGETVASWAVCEPGRGWAPHEPSVTATPTDSGYRIDGIKDRVEAGAQSQVLLVVARSGDEVRQFLVPTDAAGVRIEAQQSIDLVKHYARVHFDGVVVEPSAAVGSPAETAGLIDRQR